MMSNIDNMLTLLNKKPDLIDELFQEVIEAYVEFEECKSILDEYLSNESVELLNEKSRVMRKLALKISNLADEYEDIRAKG